MMFGLPFFVKLFGGLSAILAIALAVVMFRADAISGERNELREWQGGVVSATRLASGQLKLPADRVAAQIFFLGDGVIKLRGEIDKLNRDAMLRADAFEQSKAGSVREIARLAEAAKMSDARIARLQRLAQAPPGQCKASPELLEALEGL